MEFFIPGGDSRVIVLSEKTHTQTDTDTDAHTNADDNNILLCF